MFAIQTWFVIIYYIYASLSTYWFVGRLDYSLLILLIGGIVAYFVEQLAKTNQKSLAWAIALFPVIVAVIVFVIAQGTALGIVMSKYYH